MSFQATPKEALVLWNLLTNTEEPAVSKVKPKFTRAECNPLVAAGLIELEKRGQSTHLVLTDRAWAWASENQPVKFPPKSTATVPVLEALVELIVTNVQLNKITLAEFLRPRHQSTTDSDAISTISASLEEKIRAAYSKASGGSYNVRVRLSELRQKVGDLSREEIDKTLGEMELSGKLVLMPINDPQAISSEDEAAAINVGGHQRHIVYMKG